MGNKIFKRKPKEITPTPHRKSITTIFKNKIHPSKIQIKDVKMLEGVRAKDLKKQFSVTGSKAKLLDQLVADYKGGKLSSLGMARKKPSKPLDKKQLNQMIESYAKSSKKRDYDQAKKNAHQLKKKFNLDKDQAKRLDSVIEKFNKGNGSKLQLANTLLDSNKISKHRLQKLIDRYEEGRKRKRGVSYLMTPSLISVLPSKQKIENLMGEMKSLLYR